MTIHILCLAAATILGAITRRFAGGGFRELTSYNPGDLPTRASWGLACAVAVQGPWWLYPAVALGVLLGCATPIHWRSLGIQIGRRFYGWELPPRYQFGGTENGRGENGWFRDVSGLTLHGLGNMALPAAAIWWAGGAWWWPLLAGVTIAGWYQLGLWLPDRPRWPLWLRDGPRFAELIWGAVCAVACGL